MIFIYIFYNNVGFVYLIEKKKNKLISFLKIILNFYITKIIKKETQMISKIIKLKF